MFDVSLCEATQKFNLSSLIRQRDTGASTDLNVILLSKLISSDVGKGDYNQVLDALIRIFSDQQVTLFDRQKPMAVGLGLNYSMRHANSSFAYNFTFRETPYLVNAAKKINLTKTSLLAVLIEREKEVNNLKEILTASMEPYA